MKPLACCGCRASTKGCNCECHVDVCGHGAVARYCIRCFRERLDERNKEAPGLYVIPAPGNLVDHLRKTRDHAEGLTHAAETHNGALIVRELGEKP